jgi:anion-transporting  ArsA/GET3 family ATPase
MSLFDRRLLFVLGKGGVGKTTVTAAIALSSARSGRRTLAVEVGSQGQLAALLGGDAATTASETPLLPNLSGLSLDPQRALEEYLAMTIRVRAIAERLADSRVTGYVAAAAPGLREMVTLGKIWHLTDLRLRDGSPRYDLVVIDAPATGHAVGMLRTPRQFGEIARVGRIADEATRIAELLADRSRTGIVLVTLPEEMPVNETADAARRLVAAGLEADCVVVNALYPALFEPGDDELLRAAQPAGDVGAAAVGASLSHIVRRREQAAELERLSATLGLPRTLLPFLFRPDVDIDGIGELAAVLGPDLETLP